VPTCIDTVDDGIEAGIDRWYCCGTGVPRRQIVAGGHDRIVEGYEPFIVEGYEPFALPSDGRTSHAIRHASGRARIEMITIPFLSCVNEDVISEKRYIELVVVS
jgi:hypothetical protein